MRPFSTPGFVLVAALALLPAAAQAGPAPAAPSDSGAVSFQDLDLFPRDKLSVEINLEGPLLRMVSESTKREDPAFAKVLAGLQAIRVQVFPLQGKGSADALRPKVDRAVHWLEERGWQSTVRVRDKGDETYIYLKEAGGKVVGLTVLSLENGGDAALINIVGTLDPAEIGRLGSSFGIPQLKKVGGKP